MFQDGSKEAISPPTPSARLRPRRVARNRRPARTASSPHRRRRTRPVRLAERRTLPPTPRLLGRTTRPRTAYNGRLHNGAGPPRRAATTRRPTGVGSFPEKYDTTRRPPTDDAVPSNPTTPARPPRRLNLRGNAAGRIRFPSNGFTYSLTLFSKCFSSFPHGTFSLSVSCPYLALGGVYHPLWAAFPNNPTLGKCLVARGPRPDTGFSPSAMCRSKQLGPPTAARIALLETTIRRPEAGD